MAFLEDYDYELEHPPGHTNTVADLLSRKSNLSEGVKINDSAIVLPEHLFSHKISITKQDHPVALRLTAFGPLHQASAPGVGRRVADRPEHGGTSRRREGALTQSQGRLQ